MPNRTCSICKTKKPPESCLKVGLRFVCGEACKTELIRKTVEKVRKKKHQADKKRIETLEQCFTKAQADCNWYIRERDWNLPCISCDRPIEKVGTNYQAGHLIHAGSKYRTCFLRMDPDIIFGQCKKCNFYSESIKTEMEKGIIARFGQEYLDNCYELQRKYDRGEMPKATKEEVRARAKEFRALARELKRKREQ